MNNQDKHLNLFGNSVLPSTMGRNCPNFVGCLGPSIRKSEFRASCPVDTRNICLHRASQYISYRHMLSDIPQMYASARFTDIDNTIAESIQSTMLDENGVFTGNVICLSGPVGVGKTWTAAAIVAQLEADKIDDDNCEYKWLDGRYLDRTFRDLWQQRDDNRKEDVKDNKDPYKNFLTVLKTCDLVVIDGFYDTSISPIVVGEIMDIIDRRSISCLTTVITTNMENIDDIASMLTKAKIENLDAALDRVLERFVFIPMYGESRRSTSLKKSDIDLKAPLSKWVAYIQEKPKEGQSLRVSKYKMWVEDHTEELQKMYTVTQETTPEEWAAIRLRLKKQRDRADERDLMYRGMYQHKWIRPKLEYITNHVCKPGVYVRRVREHLEDMAEDPNFMKSLWLETRFITEDDFDRYRIYRKLKKEVKNNPSTDPKFDFMKEFKARCRAKSKKKEEKRALLIEMRDEDLIFEEKIHKASQQELDRQLKLLEKPINIEESIATADRILHELRSYDELTDEEREEVDKERLARHNAKMAKLEKKKLAKQKEHKHKKSRK